MTKREHDEATKNNYGAPTGDRTAYRTDRGHVRRVDYIGQRAAYMARRNTSERIALDGRLSTLGTGSLYRSLAAHRVSTGAPLLA